MAETPMPMGSTWRRSVRFVITWVKLSWKDILTIAIIGATSLGVYNAPVPFTRNFPITFTTSGDIVYPDLAYPSNRGWVISPTLSGVLSSVIPIAVIALAQLRIRSFWDFNNAILGVLYSLALGALFQAVVKVLVGSYRPYWLDVCQPDVSRAAANNDTGLNGVGFRQIMFTPTVCTNTDTRALRNAMTGFPSGHATAGFAGYTFLFLWMNAKLKVWADFQAGFYWLALLLAPALGAVLIAGSLTIDMAHHWYDIVGGSLLGFAVAVMVYRLLYAAVWDWRFNHIPLRRDRVFDYAAAAGLMPEIKQRYVFTTKLGWGRKRKSGLRRARGKGADNVRNGVNSRKDTELPEQPEEVERIPQERVSYPSPAAVRGDTSQCGGREEMV
ncbi:hypothetical protein VTJ83DRAFT_2841 [Remersonia thermophila]|uniref:Phosphatidic acid phosphatase type 2/haloperoxidase domain-containing protein n=1 Tax=Remersonia thermophila TaxID=72144 RepID=A0ABR4DCC6_9PEZI